MVKNSRVAMNNTMPILKTRILMDLRKQNYVKSSS